MTPYEALAELRQIVGELIAQHGRVFRLERMETLLAGLMDALKARGIGREAGFYRVQLGETWATPDKWIVAEWDGEKWAVPGEGLQVQDSEFSQIIERPIPMERG